MARPPAGQTNKTPLMLHYFKNPNRLSARGGTFSCSLVFAATLSLLCSAVVAQTNRPIITSSTNALGTVGQPFIYTITASGGATSFGASGLPAGLIPPAAGSPNITGLPQLAGAFSSTMSAANGNGTTVTNLGITINPPPAPQLASPATVFALRGQALNYPLLSTPNHSNVPTTFSATGLPSGATLISNVTTNASFPNILVTNYFINSPSLLTNGSFVVPVIASNGGGASTNSVTFIINPTNVPQFTTNSNSVAAILGVPFSYDLTALNSPLRFRVTNIVVGGVTNNVNITNGPLINGFSFSNVSVGGTTFARVFGTPGQANSVRLGIEAANNSGSSSSAVTNTNYALIINVSNSVPTVVLSQPLGEVNFAAGSSFFANAQVFDRLPDVIIPSSVTFTAGGNTLPGVVGRLGDLYGVEFYPESSLASPFDLQASGQNSLGQASSSSIGMRRFSPAAALPTISMLPVPPGPAPQAGGFVTLRAAASSSQTPIQRVEFYANKVLVGFATNSLTAGEYEFAWRTPSTPGSYEINARVVSQNGTGTIIIAPGPPATTVEVPVYASVITRAPTIINTLPGVAPSVAITSPANNGTLAIGVPNRISASASLTGGAVASVAFYANGKLIDAGVGNNPDTSVPFEVDFTPNSFGTYEIFAIATGSNGLQTVSPVVTVNVPTGFVPSVAITSPTSGLTLPLGQPVVVEYTSNDTDGFVAKVELLANGAVVSSLPSAGAGSTTTGLIGNGSFPYTPPSQGAYEFAVRVTDDRGNSGISAPVRITVQSGATSPLPTVILDQRPISETRYTLGSSLLLNATATAKGTNTISAADVKFFLNGNQTPASNSGIAPRPGIFTTLFTPPDVGTYEVRATARDSAGNTGLSGLTSITFVAPTRPFPEVQMLQLNPGTVPVQGGLLNLQARAVFPGAINVGGDQQRVEFYVNGAFVGVGTNSQAAPSDFSYVWRVPSGLNALTNSYTVQARAVAIDFLAAISPPYSSVFSANSVTFTPGPVGAAPVVEITAPEKREFTMPQAPLTLLWSSRDPDGFVLFSELFVNGQLYIDPITAPQGLYSGGNGTVVYQFPSEGRYVFVIRATDNSGNTAESAPTTVTVNNSFADPSPVVTLNNATFSDTGYVVGSQLYFNATATAAGTNTIPTNGVSFALGSTISLPGAKTSLTLGNNPVFSSPVYLIGAGSPSTVTARATDSQGNVGFSPLNSFYFGNPLSPLPSVTMVTNTPVTPPAAGGSVELRALAIFPVSQFNQASTDVARVEFYANGVLLGEGIPVDQTNSNSVTTLPYSHAFPWLIPTNASGDFRITARAVQLNFNQNLTNNNVRPFYGSTISLNSAQLTVSSVPSNLVPGSNGAFVVEMYRKLLYRDPDYNEWAGYKEALDSAAMDRATVVMTIMGFDQTLKVFNRDSFYGRTSGTAMLPFARLGLTPTETQVRGFISALELDRTPLPSWENSLFGGLPGAPWNATYGMARGIQEVVIASTAFRRAYPAVTGLANTPFVDWMRVKMFQNVYGGAENRIVNMMSTIVPPSIKQGAAMAFRSEWAWVSLEAGTQVAPEQNLQLRANTAMLNFQLNGNWNLTKTTPLYSKQVVEGILASAGYITSTSAPAAVARAQTISFRPPATVYAGRTYRLSARSTSTLPVTLLLQDLDAATSIVSSGPNALTFKVNKAGSIKVIAAQPGGTTKAGKAFLAAMPVQSNITAVQK